MKKALFLVAALTIAAIAPAQKTYQLRLNAKPGQSFRYLMEVTSGGAQASKIGIQMNMKIAKVEKGLFTVNTTMGSMTINGQPAPQAISDQMKQLVLINVMDTRGKVVRSETKGLPGMPTNQGTSVPLPAKPIRIGESWTGETEIQGKKIKTSYKLIGVKPIGGKPAAVIHATPEQVPQMKLDGPMVFSIELSSGFPISMSMSGKGEQGGVTRTMKMTMRRL